MINEIIGKKIRMTQVFAEDGTRVPVTIIEAGPCPVVQRKSMETDGYNAVQIGFMSKKKKLVNRPMMTHLKKYGAGPVKILKEARLADVADAKDVKEVTVDIFTEGDRVDVSGVTKGRGFAGVFKRYNMRGAPATHGAHESYRHVGSLAGSRCGPRRVWAGKRLPGHMGCEKKTMLNLEVIQVIKNTNHIMVKGAVPGANGGIVRIRKTNRG